LPFLSNALLDALRFTAEQANELGLRMDLTLGSGWPYGGPQIPIDLAAGRLRYEHVALTPGRRRVPLPSIGAGERLLAAFVATSDGSSGGSISGGTATSSSGGSTSGDPTTTRTTPRP